MRFPFHLYCEHSKMKHLSRWIGVESLRRCSNLARECVIFRIISFRHKTWRIIGVIAWCCRTYCYWRAFDNVITLTASKRIQLPSQILVLPWIKIILSFLSGYLLLLGITINIAITWHMHTSCPFLDSCSDIVAYRCNQIVTFIKTSSLSSKTTSGPIAD